MTTIIAKKSDWARLFGVAGAYVKEAKIMVENNKVSCLAVDPAHVAIIKCSIKCEGTFDGSVCVNVEQFMKALNACGGEQPIIEVDDYVTELKFIGTATIKMPLLADLGEIRDIPRDMFEGEIASGTFVPGNLEQPISYCMWGKEQIVSIKMKDSKLTFEIGTDRNTAEIISDTPATGIDAESTYPLDYFEALIKQTKGTDTVTIEIPQSNYPMQAKWNVGTGHYSVVIAPRVEQ